MATAVERPLPDTTNREIIDVDQFDFSPHPGQGHREQIYFVDSDGEEDFIEILSPRLQTSSINGEIYSNFVKMGQIVDAVDLRQSTHQTLCTRRTSQEPQYTSPSSSNTYAIFSSPHVLPSASTGSIDRPPESPTSNPQPGTSCL